MANYYGSWRTNYFRVKEKKKFLQWAHTLPESTAEVNENGCMLMMSEDADSGGIPNCRFVDGNALDFDLLDELSSHLARGEVAIIMASGAEKLRYLVGYAGAINNAGKRIEISLNDIYKRAIKLGKNITPCEY